MGKNVALIASGILAALFNRCSFGDLLVNGNFSAGNTGFSTDYSYSAGSDAGPGQYTVGSNPQLFNGGANSYEDHSTGTGSMLEVDGSPNSDASVWEETVPVTLDVSYVFTGWYTPWVSPDASPALLELEINGTQIGSTFSPITSAGQWNQYTATWASGSSSSATLRIVDQNLAGNGNDFSLDDLSFAPVPEPASGVFAALALIGLGTRRARRNVGGF